MDTASKTQAVARGGPRLGGAPLAAPFANPAYAPLGAAVAAALGLRVTAWWRGRAGRA